VTPLHLSLNPFRPLLTRAAYSHAHRLAEIMAALHRQGEMTDTYDTPETIDHDALAALVAHLHQWFELADEEKRSQGPAARGLYIQGHIALIELRACLSAISAALHTTSRRKESQYDQNICN
jgi:hypothetical protein